MLNEDIKAKVIQSPMLKALTDHVDQRLQALESKEAPEMKLITATAAVIEKHLGSELEALRQAIERDVQSDTAQANANKEVMKALEKHTATMNRLTVALEEFTKAYNKPKSRTGIVELPTGKVKMTVKED